MRIPVWRGGKRNGGGEIVAYTEVDDDRADLAAHRWYLSGDGYATRMRPFAETGYPRQSIALHREVMGLQHGDPDQVDHRDRDRLNNRRENLRVIPAEGQAHNQTQPGRTSNYRGVYLAEGGKRWRAKVRNRFLGTFDTEQEAAEAARAERLRVLKYALD